MEPGTCVLPPAREANLILSVHLGPGGSSAHSLELGDVEKYQCGPWEAGGWLPQGQVST